MTAGTNPTGTPSVVRLPIWAIGALLVIGFLSVLLAPGTFLTIVWMVILGVSIYGVWKNFSSEVKRLRAAHAVSGQTLDKDKLKSDAREALPVPLWLAVLLAVGTLWAAITVFKVLGFLLGLLIFLLVVAAIGFAGYLAYKELKKRGNV